MECFLLINIFDIEVINFDNKNNHSKDGEIVIK